MFSIEFFNQRSFEVVWAVFRVGEYVSRSQVKKTLEERALDYFVARESTTLDALEEIVRLSSYIEEISSVNAGVLLREIGNLRAAYFELKEKGAVPSKGKETHLSEKAPSIEGSFSKPPMLLSEFMNMAADTLGGDMAKKDEKTVAAGNAGNGGNGKRERDIDSIKEAISVAIGKKQESLINGLNGGVLEFAGNAGNAGNDDDDGGYTPILERQKVIMETLSKKTYSTLKDVAESLPSISARTIRSDIKRMADAKMIERIGGGNHWFLKLSKKKA